MPNKNKSGDKSQLIYLAEDNEDDIFLFQEALTDCCLKYKLCVYKSGNELVQALSALLPARPDIIFLDINMPEKDGFESLQLIRKVCIKRPAVFFLSSSFNSTSVKSAIKNGATGYLTKQSSFSVFRAMLVEVLLKNRAGWLKEDFYVRQPVNF